MNREKFALTVPGFVQIDGTITPNGCPESHEACNGCPYLRGVVGVREDGTDAEVLCLHFHREIRTLRCPYCGQGVHVDAGKRLFQCGGNFHLFSDVDVPLAIFGPDTRP